MQDFQGQFWIKSNIMYESLRLEKFDTLKDSFAVTIAGAGRFQTV